MSGNEKLLGSWVFKCQKNIHCQWFTVHGAHEMPHHLNLKQNLENFLDLILIIQYVNLQGKDDYLGRCMLFPKVRLKGIEAPEPKLLWHKVKRGGQDGGEILAECELFLVRRSKLKRSVFRLFVYVHRWICKAHWKEKKRRFLSSHRACVVPRTSIVVF